MAAPRIALVAGEASGDLLAAHLITALAARLPGAAFCGIGGPRMQAAGFAAWWPSDKLAVRGYVEVLRHYREITGIRRALTERLLADPPDLFIGVDAPDFNLDLETRLRAGGVRTAHFISPSIWAWRGERITNIRAACEEMLCVFPFEEKLYRDAGISATYVGHPLADVIAQVPDRAGARARLGLPDAGLVVALLPGSRQSELKYLAERFVRAAVGLARAMPGVRFVVPLASEATATQWNDAVRECGADAAGFVLAPRDSHTALAACDVALVASGTATLEAALFKRPMVIAYNMARISWEMMRRMKYQPWVGLPNILCGEFIVPEFLQDDATPENLAQALANLIADPTLRTSIEARFARLHEELRCGMPTRAAGAIAARFFPAVAAPEARASGPA
jgi:lipid-A-disaccharide synthase